MTAIYVASPLDQNPDRIGGVPGLIGLLMDSGATAVFNPGTAWVVDDPGGLSHKTIQDINVVALQQSDGVLAVLPPGVPTVGTPMEILLARQSSIPVVVVGTRSVVALTWLDVPVVEDPQVAVDTIIRLATEQSEGWGS